jgi:hypothetical protein
MTATDREGVAAAVVAILKHAMQPRDAKIAALERRVEALERKPFVKFCGVWKADRGFDPGDAVVHHGGLWICKAATSGEPSKDFDGWQLAVKRGSAS